MLQVGWKLTHLLGKCLRYQGKKVSNTKHFWISLTETGREEASPNKAEVLSWSYFIKNNITKHFPVRQNWRRVRICTVCWLLPLWQLNASLNAITANLQELRFVPCLLTIVWAYQWDKHKIFTEIPAIACLISSTVPTARQSSGWKKLLIARFIFHNSKQHTDKRFKLVMTYTYLSLTPIIPSILKPPPTSVSDW